MQNTKQNRLRRAKETRIKIEKSGKYRLVVNRTNKHIYAQIFDSQKKEILVSASTLEKSIKAKILNGCTVEAAKVVGELIAQKSLEKNINEVAFDRSGFKYHGRVKALADSARSAGMKF
ncbi:50S ribosomal protein L18 [Nitrosomonas mobilis]|uniref:Large ribosomal subunit protein uL18 n=1 Tax=Nitrosomonas mobilis TaxID=51642 RepID=A0A1G5SDC5_9PROT|nr:50S ribosomal protein L18 [Nitrosomonas mobilis]SCZ85204.1 50S ribosomal subunit protein L18 [Nitrosomonas mobilis]